MSNWFITQCDPARETLLLEQAFELLYIPAPLDSACCCDCNR
jgi:hypothetical protein